MLRAASSSFVWVGDLSRRQGVHACRVRTEGRSRQGEHADVAEAVLIAADVTEFVTVNGTAKLDNLKAFHDTLSSGQ